MFKDNERINHWYLKKMAPIRRVLIFFAVKQIRRVLMTGVSILFTEERDVRLGF